MDAPATPARKRKAPEHLTVTHQRQQGFRDGGEAQQVAQAAGRGQQQGDDGAAPAGSPDAAPAPRGGRGQGGRARGRSQCRGRDRGRGRGRGCGDDDASPAAPAAAAAAAAAAPSTALPVARAVADNHLRLYMDRGKATAPQFKLRTGGGTKKGEELTEVARFNLLIEMGACRGDRHEEELVCKHYNVDESTGRRIMKKWRERATARTATRRGRTSITGSLGSGMAPGRTETRSTWKASSRGGCA